MQRYVSLSALQKRLPFRDSKLFPLILIGLLLLLLVGTTIYGSVKASDNLINNSDAINNTYMVADGLSRHDIYVQNQHSNLLKFPLFYLQGKSAYGVKSFYAVNAALSLITIVGWLVLLVLVFGKKYLALFCLYFSSISLASVLFDIDITYTTVRNIEYVITLGFIVCIGNYIFRSWRQSRIWLTVFGGLYTIVLASDNLQLYVYTLTLLLVLGALYYVKAAGARRRILHIAALVIGTAVVGLALKIVFRLLGLVVVNKVSDAAQSVVSWNLLFPSLSEAARQVIVLQGGNIFGGFINASLLGSLLNLGLFVAALAGFSLYFRNRFASDAPYTSKDFVVIAAATAGIMTFLTYILDNQVATQAASGMINSRGQDRYLTAIMLINAIGLVLLVQYFQRLRRPSLTVLLTVAALVAVICNFHYRQLQFAPLETSDHAARTSHVSIAQALQKDHITVAVSGYWNAATTRFWIPRSTHFRYADVQNCNQAFTFVTRKDWYRPSPFVHQSALIVDRTPGNAGDSLFWNNCSDAVLVRDYGQPVKKQSVLGVNGRRTVQIWVYNYDIRSRIDSRDLQSVGG